MTDLQGQDPSVQGSSAQGAPAAGWYADPTGQAGVRWWDGAQWTAHSAPLPAGGPGAGGAAPARPMLPATTPVYTPFIWVILLLPLLSDVLLFFWHPVFRMTTIRGVPTLDPLSIYTPMYFALQGLGWVLYGLSVVFAVMDRRALLSRGVVRPFHWAWAFLGSIVYVIGRSVIVRQVARPRGLVPIWVQIAVLVVQLVVGIVLASEMIASMSAILPSHSGA